MKNLVLGLVWLAGSITAIAIAWQGANFVDAQVIEPLPATQLAQGCEPGESECSSGSPGVLPGAAEGDAPLLSSSPVGASSELAATANGVGGEGASATASSSEGLIPAGSATSDGAAIGSSFGGTVAPADGAAVSTPAATTNVTVPGTTPSSTSTATTTTVTPTTTKPPTTSTSKAPTTTSQTTTTAKAPTTTSPPPTTATTAPPTTSTTAPTQTKTFNLVGGTTAVAFSPSGVSVLWATPKSGFTVTVAQEPPGMKVEFRSDDHRSRVDVWWDNGPQWLIREKADD